MQTEKKNHSTFSTKSIVISLIVVAALLAVGLSSMFLLGSNVNSQIPKGSQVTMPLVNQPIAIKGDAADAYQVVVPQGATNVQITGSFTVVSGSDIEVMVMNNTNYQNWLNTNQGSTIYDSGKVSSGSLAVVLPSSAGTYYLVYNNVYSTAGKNVTGQSSLVYTSG